MANPTPTMTHSPRRLDLESGLSAICASTDTPPCGEESSMNSRGIPSIEQRFSTEGEAAQPRSHSPLSSTFNQEPPEWAMGKTRQEFLEDYLEPLLPLSDAPRNRFMLLCWGQREQCHVKSVFLQETDDDVAIWRTLYHAWSESRSSLRRFLSCMLRIKTVDIVHVCFLVICCCLDTIS